MTPSFYENREAFRFSVFQFINLNMPSPTLHFISFLFCVVLPSHAWAQNTEIEQLKTDIAALEQALDNHRIKNPYIVIDTKHNRLQIWQNNHLQREAICATGSGKVLLYPGKLDQWQFHTPLGARTVLRKVVDPIWAKPIWAFVENGEKPTVLPWDSRRLDLTTLGAYALELGDGYEIHGTLYPSLLGRHITHGCIRLNDEDLAFAYRTLHVGDQVYIY